MNFTLLFIFDMSAVFPPRPLFFRIGLPLKIVEVAVQLESTPVTPSKLELGFRDYKSPTVTAKENL